MPTRRPDGYDPDGSGRENDPDVKRVRAFLTGQSSTPPPDSDTADEDTEEGDEAGG